MNMSPMRRKSLDGVAFIMIAALLVAWTLLAGICLLLCQLLFGDLWRQPAILMVIGVTVMAIVAGVKLVCRILRGGDVDQSGDR